MDPEPNHQEAPPVNTDPVPQTEPNGATNLKVEAEEKLSIKEEHSPKKTKDSTDKQKLLRKRSRRSLSRKSSKEKYETNSDSSESAPKTRKKRKGSSEKR